MNRLSLTNIANTRCSSRAASRQGGDLFNRVSREEARLRRHRLGYTSCAMRRCGAKEKSLSAIPTYSPVGYSRFACTTARLPSHVSGLGTAIIRGRYNIKGWAGLRNQFDLLSPAQCARKPTANESSPASVLFELAWPLLGRKAAVHSTDQWPNRTPTDHRRRSSCRPSSLLLQQRAWPHLSRSPSRWPCR